MQERETAGVVQRKQPFAFLSGCFCFFGSALAEPFGKPGKVFLLVYKEHELIVFVQDIVAESDAQRGELLVYLAQAGLLFGRKIGAGTYEIFVCFVQKSLLFGCQA